MRTLKEIISAIYMARKDLEFGVSRDEKAKTVAMLKEIEAEYEDQKEAKIIVVGLTLDQWNMVEQAVSGERETYGNDIADRKRLHANEVPEMERDYNLLSTSEDEIKKSIKEQNNG